MRSHSLYRDRVAGKTRHIPLTTYALTRPAAGTYLTVSVAVPLELWMLPA